MTTRTTMEEALRESAGIGLPMRVNCPTCSCVRDVGEIVSALPEDGIEADWLCVSDILDTARATRLAQEALTLLERVRENQWERLKAGRAEAERVARTTFGLFDNDDSSRIKISGKLIELSMLGDSAGTVRWKMADNRVRSFSPADFLQASLAIGAYVQAVHDLSWQLEQRIAEADTIQSVQAIVWPEEMPQVAPPSYA